MDAASLAFSVAQTLLSALQLLEIKEIIHIYGYEPRLKKLEGTVTRINAVLQDAEAQEELSREQQLDLVGKLKDAVYDADDLFNEFITRKKQQQIRNTSKGQGKLNGITSDAAKFGFKCDYTKPIRRGRSETGSYVYAESVIGRDDDKIKIVNMLLDANVEGVLPVLSIMGIGGLGRTTLAQLVFNEKRTEKEFPKRLWVCASDQY
ncbi:hypothetical protein Cgig2_008588 [Carnegiea gigantea]|uniref:Uncharacterized protein n=1 Tax=Carnegiea gigantea TaxID=171969 RepID=A0A9Q1GRI3_9CARY|nr:hypothetical protein Cgig2_008588 [Carnegiea gigantea]